MLDQLIEKSELFDTEKADFVAQARTFRFDDNARIVPPDCMGLSVQPLIMTENALRQTCSKLGPAVFGRGSAKSLPFDYIDTIPADLRAICLNNHIEHANGSKWMVRAYQDKCRAISLLAIIQAVRLTMVSRIRFTCAGLMTLPARARRQQAVTFTPCAQS